MNRLLTSAAFGFLLCVVQAQPGTIDTTFNPTDIGFGNGDGPNDGVFDSALQPDGKIIVVGVFTSYNGTSRNRLARVNADGSLDDSFNPGLGPNGGIFMVILQPDGKIIIGGVFTSFNGTGRNHVARLNSDGSLDVSFDPGIGANGTIRTGVLQSDGKIIIGGDFTSYGGTGRNRVARLNPNGSLDTGFDPGTGANSIVWSVNLQTDGRILLGGSFFVYNGTGRNNIARLNSNGTLDASFNPGTGANGAVYGLVLQPDGKVIIGGDFSSYNGTGRNRLARLNSTGSLDTSFLPGSGPNSSVIGLAWQPDGKVVFGGSFSSVNGVSRSGVARLNADGTWDAAFNQAEGANGVVYSIVLQSDGKVFCAGGFVSYNTLARNRLARLNADGSLDLGFNAGSGANATVLVSSLLSDGRIVIGGEITTYNGTSRNYIARLLRDGEIDQTFDPGTGANGDVQTCIVQPDEKVIIGGNFTSYNGIARNRIARLNSNGALDATFDPGSGVSLGIYAMALQADGKIIIGGDFTTYNGTARNRIARLNPDGSLDVTFTPGSGANGQIRAIALQPDGKLIIAGYFTSYAGTARSRIARLNSDGSLDNTFNPGAGADGGVQSATLQPDGKILIAGFFTQYNGVGRNYIARVNANGSLDTSFTPGDGANGPIQSISLQPDGRMVIGGWFTVYNGVNRSRLARLNTSGGIDSAFDPGTGAGDHIYTTAVQPNGKVIIGGRFTSYNATGRNRLARVNGDYDCPVLQANVGDPCDDGDTCTLNDAIMSTCTCAGEPDLQLEPWWGSVGSAGDKVYAVVKDELNGIVYVAGEFDSIGGQPRSHIAALSTGTGQVTSWNPGADGVIFDLALGNNGLVYAAGYFTSIGGQSRTSIAALDPSTGNATPWDPDPDQGVFTIAVDGGTIYAGGQFTSIGGQNRSLLAALDANTGSATAWNPDVSGSYVEDVLVNGGIVYVAGGFHHVGGEFRSNIAALSATSGDATLWDPDAVGAVTDMVLSGNTIYAAGDFISIGGQPRNHIAALDAVTGLATPFNPNAAPSHVRALAVDGNTVFAGGQFTQIGGQPRSYLAALDPYTGIAQTWDAEVDNAVYALCVSGSTVHAGGQFTHVGALERRGLAVFSPCPQPTWYADTDGDGYGDANVALAAATQPEGFVANSNDCDDTDANLTVPGDPCNDGNPNTYSDVITPSCVCTGLAYNDECSNAIPLTAHPAITNCANVTSASTVGATPSGGACSPTANDVWFTVETSNSNAFSIDLTPLGPGDMGIEVLESCGGSSIYCATGLHHLILAQGEFVVRVFATTPVDFTICALRAPLNNEYSGAEFIDLQQAVDCPANAVMGTTSVATSSGAATCASGPDPDVWYGFSSVGATMVNVDLVANGATGLGVQLFDATLEDTLHCALGNSHTIPVAPYSEYLLKVFSATPGDFTICASYGQPAVTANVRVLLDGPYNTATGLMDDDLRSVGFFPHQDPYPGMGYVHTGCGLGGTIASVFTVSGDNAVVDWVVVELRDPNTPSTVVASRTGLLQRDGDVVALDGVSTLPFYADAGSYHVAVRHRNHLGCMTSVPVALGAAPASVDFTSLSTATWGTNARKTSGGAIPKQVLWAGDVTINHQLKYTGTGNDRDPILVTVGSTTPNNVLSSTYSTNDVNMDGVVKYTGTGNDRDPILVNVGSTTPNNVRTEQLP